MKDNQLTEDFLSFTGSEIKDLGNGKIGGYLVIFSDPSSPDLAGDFFTKDTDFGTNTTSQIYFSHGLDKTLQKKVIGKGNLKIDDVGVWITAQLELRDEYEKAIYTLAKNHKLGWSSGTASHLVERESVKGANFIKTWPLGLDASLTPTPCEPRTSAIPIKEISVDELSVKALISDKQDCLMRSIKEIHPNAEYLDHDDENIYFALYEGGLF